MTCASSWGVPLRERLPCTEPWRKRRHLDPSGFHPTRLRAPLTQTTPHMHSWLIFTNIFTDANHQTVLSQYVEMGGSLAPIFRQHTS